jgi:hypothetical protein
MGVLGAVVVVGVLVCQVIVRVSRMGMDMARRVMRVLVCMRVVVVVLVAHEDSSVVLPA